MNRENSATPLFAQVRDRLRASILDGSFASGNKLPSEAELEKSYGVSRVTVRQALSELQAQGLIEKVNGRGSFVRGPGKSRSEPGPLSGFYETMRRRGHVTSGTVSGIKRVEADATVAAALRLPTGAPVGMLTITRLVDDEVYTFQQCFGGPRLLEALLAEDLGQNDLLSVLKHSLGYPVVGSHLDFEAVNATATLAKRLRTRVDAALLRIHITSYDAQEMPIMYNDFYARGDRFRYRLNAAQ